MTERRPYVARITGWVAGRRMSAGDPVWLTPEAALCEPVTPAEDAVTPDAVAEAATVEGPLQGPEKRARKRKAVAE